MLSLGICGVALQATPMHQSGSRTPMHSGMATPMHAWGAATPMHPGMTPGTPSYDPTRCVLPPVTCPLPAACFAWVVCA